MAEDTIKNKKDFISCLFILAAIYSCGTLLYFSQSFLLYKFFDKGIILEMLSGWNYLSQAIGIILFVFLYKSFNNLLLKRKAQALISLSLLPIITISIFTKSGYILILMMVLLNIVIGVLTAYAFSLIATYIKEEHFTTCFAGAYAIGGIITCLICRLNEEIMVSYFVIILTVIFVAIICTLIMLYKDIDNNLVLKNTFSDFKESKNSTALLHLVIALMAIIFALGSNDPILVESGSKIDMVYTRFFYAGGLLLAAFIFDKNHTIGSICALASILYPIMIIILYKEMPIHYIVVALTDTFLGFYSVFRAGVFINLAAKKGMPNLASLGLGISRIVEGVVVIALVFLRFDRLTYFIIAGVLFIPLIIMFCYLLTQNPGQPNLNLIDKREVLKPSFAQTYNLTRREEEICSYLAKNKTNSEIASILFVSESTVRFHVSNILKKSGLKNRNEIARKYSEHIL